MKAMKKLLLTTALLVFAIQFSYSQAYFSYFQLRELVPQTQSLQPAFIPKGTFTFGLPTAGFLAQSDFKLRDLISKQSGDVNFEVNFDVMLAASAEINTISTDVTANLFHVGYKTKNGAYSLFANARASIDLRYGKDLMEFLANGNSNRIGAEINLSDTRIFANTYHEIGIGHAHKFLEDRLTVGARVKMITGLFHASTAEGASGTLYTNEIDNSWRVSLQNATINTAGLDLLMNSDDYESNATSSYAMSNQNKTVAFDLGAKFKVLDWLTVEAAMNDIGTINWKEQVRNYNTADTTVTISGIQLRGLENSSDSFKDSIQNKFRSNETQKEFSTSLPMKTYLAASLFLTSRDKFTVIAFNNHVFKEIDPSFAVAYNHTVNKFTFGVLGSYRGPQNEVNLGLNLATDIGPMQLYLATDNMLISNKPEQYSKMDFRFGLNLMFGYKKWSSKSDAVDLDSL
ncbi:hypothetical protein AWN68_05225 [Roseivirga echinicomitans]|uniref:DUF5723 domain-containing protein n=2 Tax=Roseivirga echinicomitans TaxID=296218 RepID=A0A150XK00_9BACT|nr:hypothetical protein AWN68_05225 [Roseivirga echinicomitans]